MPVHLDRIGAQFDRLTEQKQAEVQAWGGGGGQEPRFDARYCTSVSSQTPWMSLFGVC